MRRPRRTYDEHLNHEAWAIPYGDLVTLLLAFFVVMYAVSSVNEGKYRVMADAMSAAFGGAPRTLSPVQLGEAQRQDATVEPPTLSTSASVASSPVRSPRMFDVPVPVSPVHSAASRSAARNRNEAELDAIGTRIERALAPLVTQGLVTVRRSRTFLEVEIQSDLLFASGAAVPSAAARTTIEQLAGVLRDAPNALRVEGYTDDVPIHTAQFRSNWELSAARAASVLHVLSGAGVDESRLALVGYGEHHPIADNGTAAGRNANRRVQLVILAAPADRITPPPGAATVAAADAAPSAHAAAGTLAISAAGGSSPAAATAGVH